MKNTSQLALLEVAELLLKKKRKPQPFTKIFKEISEIKGLSDEHQKEVVAQFYTDFTSSAKFVYCGENTWDLKRRQNIDLWDKDGYYFNEYSEVVVEEEIVEEVIEEEIKHEVVYEEEDLISDLEVFDPIEDEVHKENDVKENDAKENDMKKNDVKEEGAIEKVEEGHDDNFLDEDKYNEYMDDYEQMYDE